MKNEGISSNVKYHVLRLSPNSDFNEELDKYIKKCNIKAASIVTCVGSLKSISIRTSDLTILEKEENYEIVSLVGNIGEKRSHIHISLSDKYGGCIGGHLNKKNNIVHTTIEISLIEYLDIDFDLEFDKETGFNELKIKQIN